MEHRFAQLAAAATFVLLIIGGMVNPTGSSLACPEPTIVCHGQLFPPMTGGVFYEHGHRLAAMTVGLLQIVLTYLLVRRRPELARLGWLALAMVVLQGTLGAITVKFKLLWYVSTGHLLLSMSYFATLVYLAFRTAPAAFDVERRRRARTPDGVAARRWVAIAAAMVFVQLLLGALVRHLGAALVCLGVPACLRTGEWWPAHGVQQLHMIHRAFGVTLAVVTTIAAIAVARRSREWRGLRVLATVAPVLALVQIALGVATVLTFRSVPVAVGHFAGAAGLWALWMSMWFLTSPRALVARAPGALPSAAETAKAS